MNKVLYRIRKDTKGKEFVASFSERKMAEKVAKRLNFDTFIEEVILDDEGGVINV